MNNQPVLDEQVQAHLRAVWKGGSVAQPVWTLQQLQLRATQFEARARKLARLDLLGFLLLPAILLIALFMSNIRVLVKEPYGHVQLAGGALLLLCSLLGALWSKRYGYAAVTSNANDLLAGHLERLSRLRDWFAATPWGTGLYLPGAALVMVGVGMNPAGNGWETPIIWTGVAAFVYLAGCIQMKIKAWGLQREIDSLEALRPRLESR